jgi:predicted lipid-binding transport protein (Tim44 family)
VQPGDILVGPRRLNLAEQALEGFVIGRSDLEQHKARNQINKVSGTKLLQGDLAEAWREGDTDYASVAMRFSMIDKTVDRASGRLVGGSEAPIEVTEVWTFVRPRAANWELSAIQQTN